MRKNSLIGGAIILTAAGFITRILGFVYRIYISNLIGSEGMGLFQLIFPVYLLTHTICCSGSFIAISKLVAEENAKREFGNMKRIAKLGCSISLLLSIILSIVLFFSSSFIGAVILNDSRTSLAIKILSFAIPFSVLNSCIKAYFYGIKEMIVPATSQVLEQISRMLAVFIIAGFFIPKGLEYACVMAVIGTGIGDFVSFLHVYITYKHSKKDKKNYHIQASKRILTIFSAFFAVAIPITANRTITTLLNSFESIIIPTKLQVFGMNSSEAMSLYGELTGMALPLILFPSLLTSALSLSLLPVVSEASAVNNQKRISFTISKALQFTSLIGIGSTCIFLSFPNELGTVIYNQPNVGMLLFFLSFICPFIYLQSTFGGILNGLGLQKTAFKNNLIGITIRICIIFFIVPIYGINAFLTSLLFSAILVSLMNLRKVLKITVLTFDFNNWLLKPILAALASGLISSYISHHFIFCSFSNKISLILSLGLLGILYTIFVFILGCITKNDFKIIKKSI